MDYQKLSNETGLVVVEIDGSGVKSGRTYTDKSTGAVKPLPGQQTAYIWQGGKYPVEVAVDFDDAKGPYRPGFYLLGGSIFASGDYGRVNFKGMRDAQLVDAGLLLDAVAVGGKSPLKAAS